MKDETSSGFYDRSFCRWLDQRFTKAPSHPAGERIAAPRATFRIDLTALVLGDFDRLAVARLQALGLAR